MEPGSILLLLALLLVVGLVISRPFLPGSQSSQSNGKSDPNERERSALLAQHEQVLRALQELDFDFALGKIPTEDYPAQRNILLQKGAAVLQKLDHFKTDRAVLPTDLQLEPAVTASSEAGTNAMRVPNGNGNGRKPTSWAVSAAVAAPDDEVEVLLANRRRDRHDRATGFCPKCGAPHQKSDRFCPKCGAKV